jgi:Asp-tRNA(Asn)/Glu-tRNA(Gln) amidotransferase A subunit family amidase
MYLKAVLLTLIILLISGCKSPDTQRAIENRFQVEELTIERYHKAYVQGKITAVDLIRLYQERIQVYDGKEGINAITQLNENATLQAAELDEEYRITGKLRPLHGVPIVVKENINVAGLETTAGSLALKGFYPKDDAEVVKRLKEAGAIILAKTNMAEWGISAHITASSVYGETRNPYNPEFTTAGSSGGTAAAVAANFAMGGIATDTGSSIRGPASHNAVVGFRPSMGMLSRKGMVPLNLRNDTPGSIARTVEDAEKIFLAISGLDSLDPLTSYARDAVAAYTKPVIQRSSMKGLRLGVVTYLTESATAPIQELFEEALLEMEAAGAVIIRDFRVPGLDSLLLDQWCAVFQEDLGSFLTSYGDEVPLKSLKELIESGKYAEYIETDLLVYQQYMMKNGIEECGGPFTDRRRIALRKAVEKSMDKYDVDVMVYPTWNRPPVKIGGSQEYIFNNSSILVPHTGQPSISVPMGVMQNRLPVGIQFTGRIFEDSRVFRVAKTYEKLSPNRKTPKLKPAGSIKQTL